MKKIVKFNPGSFFACLIPLWLLAGNALAAQPFSGEVNITFPGYSSVQLCPGDDGQPWTGAECRDYLENLRTSFDEHPDDPGLRAERARRGDFGANPLYLRGATMLVCREDGCAPLKDFRVPPPDMVFRAPEVLQRQGGLIWHRPSRVAGEPLVLELQGVERAWRSNRFRVYLPFAHLNARLEAGQGGRLLLAHDWLAELGDARNRGWIKARLDEAWIVWGVLLTIGWLALLPLRFLRQAPDWRDMFRLGIAFSLALFPVTLMFAVSVAIPGLADFGPLPLILLYWLLAPLEFFWVARSPRLSRRQTWRLWLGHKISFGLGCVGLYVFASWLV